MLRAAEFIVAERVELLDQIEIPAELQHRMLADGMMRGEKGSEFEARHGVSPERLLLLVLSGRLRAGMRQGNRPAATIVMRHGAMRAGDGSPGVSGCRRRPSCPKTARPRLDCVTAARSPRPAEQHTTDRSTTAPVPRASRDSAPRRSPAPRFPALRRACDRAAARHRAAPSGRAG